MFNVVLLCLVEVDLDEPAAVQFHANPFANNLTGKDQVLKDSIMHVSQSSAERKNKIKWVNFAIKQKFMWPKI